TSRSAAAYPIMVTRTTCVPAGTFSSSTSPAAFASAVRWVPTSATWAVAIGRAVAASTTRARTVPVACAPATSGRTASTAAAMEHVHARSKHLGTIRTSSPARGTKKDPAGGAPRSPGGSTSTLIDDSLNGAPAAAPASLLEKANDPYTAPGRLASRTRSPTRPGRADPDGRSVASAVYAPAARAVKAGARRTRAPRGRWTAQWRCLVAGWSAARLLLSLGHPPGTSPGPAPDGAVRRPYDASRRTRVFPEGSVARSRCRLPTGGGRRRGRPRGAHAGRDRPTDHPCPAAGRHHPGLRGRVLRRRPCPAARGAAVRQG